MVFEHRAFPARVVGGAPAAAVAALVAAVTGVPAVAAAPAPPHPAAPAQLPAATDSVAGTLPAPVPGATMTVHLITVGPGDSVEEMWGHNAVLVRDTAAGTEEAYNYGVFDPSAPGFYMDFFMGRGDYAIDQWPLGDMLAAYRAAGRRVWAQELVLSPVQKVELLGLLREASLPRNMFYRYDYFRNNCSTRVRDVLDAALDGQLRAATEGEAGGASWRHHTRRLAAESPLLYIGIQLLMGPRGDLGTSVWEDMWTPMRLRDTAGALIVRGSDGERIPLVSSEELWVDQARDYPAIAPPRLDSLFLLSGLLAGVALSLFGYGTRAGGRIAKAGLIAFACAWGIFCLVASVLMIALHWTEHPFTYWNQNLLLFSPLGPVVAASLMRTAAKGTTSVWGRRFLLGGVLLAAAALLLNLIPAVAQGNREMILFALPVHLAICWVMLGVHRMDGTLVYS